MKKVLLFFTFLFISTITFTQVEVIFFKLEYNEATTLFDCKIVIEAGSATSAADRLQLASQYSIIVPTGTTLAVEERFFPIYDNENYTGTLQIEWLMDNVAINPSEFPGYDVISFIPDLSSPSHFNNLSSGEEVTLFSLEALGSDICSLSLRVLDNDNDPTDIGGSDFSNNFRIGSTNDIYTGNFNPDALWTDVDVTLTEGSVCEGECITLVPTFNCIFPGLTYEWSTGETTESITICPEFNDEYILFLYGPNGFSGETTTYITVGANINTSGVTDLCVGEQVNYLPNPGVWSSSDETIVSVSNTGMVTPISEGTATISHSTISGSCTDEVSVTVTDAPPPSILGEVEICVGDMTQLSPSEGVIWESNDDAIATINNFGDVTGVSLGETTFSYTTDIGQCKSEPSPYVLILQIPEPVVTGETTICRSQMTTLTPNAGVVWESTDPEIATISDNGNVVGVSAGSVTFYFTDMATGCTSGESETVTILPSPTVQLSADTVCLYENVEATTDYEGGTWIAHVISGNPLLNNSIDSSGIIDADYPGVYSIHYINEDGCVSIESVLLTILPQPTLEVTSNSPICEGENLILSANILSEGDKTYMWNGPNGFTSNEGVVTIPNADLSHNGLYVLVAKENECFVDVVTIEVIVEDCDPCDDMSTSAGWNKVPAGIRELDLIDDFEIGESMLSGRELEDFVYYSSETQQVRLKMNNGSGVFEEEFVLTNLSYAGPKVKFDIVDINQDGLNDIVTYQAMASSSTNELDTLTFTIFENMDNFQFEKRLSVTGESGFGYMTYPVMYRDVDNQGFLDIIPYYGSIYFTENWLNNSYQLPFIFTSYIVDDFTEDNNLDIIGNENQLLINNGDRTFTMAMAEGSTISPQGLYNSETGIYLDGYLSYEITKGEIPSIVICWDPAINDGLSFFYANINNSNDGNGVIASDEGFYVFESPLTCESTFNFETVMDFVPSNDGKVDIDGNGYSDFVVVENEEIFVWVNPNNNPKIRGTAFIDNNGDGMLNENDSPLRNVLISIDPGNLSVLTDDNGNYQFAVPEGLYSLTAKVNEGEWIIDEVSIENVEIFEPCNLGFDFGFVPDPTPMPSVNLSMVNTIARCDFETRFTITVENTGTDPLITLLQFEFDDKTTLFDVEFDGSSTIGNTVNANIGPLAPFQPQEYKIKVKMPGGSSVLPMLDFKTTLFNAFGETIAEYGYTEQLRCSYDPNDKREFPDR